MQKRCYSLFTAQHIVQQQSPIGHILGELTMTKKTQAPKTLQTLRAALAAHRKADGGDISPMLNKPNSQFYVSEHTSAAIAAWGIEAQALQCFAADRNPKVCKRFAQFINAIHHHQYGAIDLTTARSLYALRAAGGSIARDALFNLLTGKVKIEGITPNTKGVGVRAIDKLFGRVAKGTAETQITRTFGSNGFARYLGMIKGDGITNTMFTLDLAHPLAQEFFKLVDNATEGQLQEMVGADE